MLWLNPKSVTLTTGGATNELAGVVAVSIDRRATRLVVEHTDVGPHVGFVDASEVRVTVKIVREVDAGAAGLTEIFAPGDEATVAWRASASASDSGGRTVTMVGVVTSVEHDFTEKRGLLQTISVLGVSSDGAADPVSEEDD